MMMRLMRRLAKDRRGAVAPTVALSLIGLLASGGIAFDYARLATMDSELQQAADQAALAGASQLDGQSGAVSRAVAAAQGLLVNQTLLGNDSGGITIQTGTTTGSVFRVYFYTSKANAEADSSPILASAAVDSTAKFIKVAVVGRQAKYALTPIVSAISSGTIGAEAVAGLGSAICKTPPVMICNPNEPAGNTNESLDFDADAFAGRGMLLITGNAVAAGNFGFLDNGDNGASALKKALGYNTPPGDCSATDTVATKTGLNASVMDALNSRFDIDTNGNSTCPNGGICSPSRNSRKDLVKVGNPTQNCGVAGNKAWQPSANPYLPPANSTVALTSNYPDMMGHPRDICHASTTSLAGAAAIGCSTAGGRIGNGVWDRDAYFRVNYGWNTQAIWTTQTRLTATATRYQVYQWELANTATAGVDATQNTAGGFKGYSYPVCLAPGITPSANVVDRRRISAAAINCLANNVQGHTTNMSVIKFVDLFLVEPSVARSRTSTSDVYVEIIGATKTGAAGSTAGQVVRRDVPYLIK